MMMPTIDELSSPVTLYLSTIGELTLTIAPLSLAKSPEFASATTVASVTDLEDSDRKKDALTEC